MIWVVLSALSIVGVRLLPPVYRAEAVVLVDSQKIPENFVSPTVSGDVTGRLALISQSIMTSSRLLNIIDTFHLYRNERKHLTQEALLQKMHEDISVNFEKSWTGGQVQAFRLAYEGQDAKTVAEVTNRLAGLYVEENARTREDQSEDTVDFLRRQLQQARESLDEQEQKVAKFKEEHNGSLPEQQSSLLGTLSSLSVELQGVQASIDRAQENELSLKAALSAAESSATSLKASLQQEAKGSMVTDSGLVLKPKSEALDDQLRALRLRYTPDYPEVQTLERQRTEAKREESEQSIAAESDGPASAGRAAATDKASTIVSPELIQTKERITTIGVQLEVVKHQRDSLEKQRAQLVAAIADCQARINTLPLTEQKMVALKRNYEESANNYNSLLQKKLAAGVATDMERSQKSERFTVIDPARIPQTPVKPKRPLLAIAGSLAGLAIGLVIGFWLELRKHTFLGEWELPPGTAILGRVPPISMADSQLTPVVNVSAIAFACVAPIHALLSAWVSNKA